MSKKQEMLQKREEMKAGYAARRDSLISKRTEVKEARRAELLEKIDSKRVSRVGYGDTNVVYVYPSDNIESEFHFDDMSEERFEKLRERLEDAGHTFKLKTHRMKNDRLVKLKFDINGSQYAYQSTAGYKELKIVFKNGSDSPSISMVPFK